MPSLYGDNLDAVVSGGEQVTADLGEALYLVTQGLAGKSPRVNATNNHWEVWDNDTQSWVDTGISAVNGAPGRDGYTPTISVEQEDNGITVTISDGRPSGTTASYFIPNGQDYVLTNADKQEIADLLDDGVPTLVTDWLDDNVTPVGSAVVVDSSLSIAGAAADAAMVGAALQRIQLPDEVKQTLLACFENVAWISDDGQDYYDALEEALYPPTGLVSISAVFTQGSAVIYESDSLDTLKQYLVVTAHFDDLSSQTITGYSLSGTLTEGTSTITASYGGKTTTFDVTVTEYNPLPSGYTKYDYISADGNAYFQIESASSPLVPLGYTVHAIAQQTTHSTSATKVVAGGGSDNAYIGFAAYSKTAGRAGAYYGASYNTFTDVANLLTAPTEFITTFTTDGVTTTTTNSGVSQTVVTPKESTAIQNSYSIRIGYSGASGSNFVGKIYLVEVKNTSDELTHQLLPCKRDSDNKIGMYDMITNQFFFSAGSSQFAAGND